MKNNKNPYNQSSGNNKPEFNSQAHSPYSGGGGSGKKKKKKSNSFLKFLMVILICTGVGYYGLNYIVTGGGAKLPNNIATPDVIDQDVVNILLAGIDYEEGRNYDDGMGLTDVVMYISYDVKGNKISMLQIPRDTYVGENVPTGGTKKLNAVARLGELDPAIANLAEVVNDQLSLPIDNYITIDMDAFKEVINALGGIEVTVPFDIEDDFGNVLEAGTNVLDGATAEFMVRQRHAYSNSDLGRLEMQRYMYSALLKTFKSFPINDVFKVMPTYLKYVKTDISLARMCGLAAKIINVPSENILMFTMPCQTYNYNGHSIVTAHKDETAEMLNEYFRPYSVPVPASELKIIELAHTVESDGTPQSMDKIDDGSAEWGEGSVTAPTESVPQDSSTTE